MKMLPASKSWLLFGVLLCTKASAGSTAESKGDKNAYPEVTTTYGSLQGKINSVKGTDQLVNAFWGIPFAKPPIGSLRFAPPQPPEPWSHMRNSTSIPPMCLQDLQWAAVFQQTLNSTLPTFTTSEDCLYLNVFTPDTEGQLPVMVWIHGGGLTVGGAATYDGSALSAYGNVVVVVIQYRLGLSGFFSTGTAEARGNWGLLDQTAALQWVQENIRSFGGDPQSVTIFGESAGGFSVGAQMVSPLSRGLFHRAISESGIVSLPGMWTPHPEVLAEEIASVSGCGTNSDELVHCLRSKTEQELKSLMKEVNSTLAVVDGVFFPKEPEELLAAKEFSVLPYLLGVNNHEYGWVIFQVLNYPNVTDGISRENATAWFQPVASILGLSAESTQKVLDEYLGDTEDPIKIRERFQDLMGDAVFVAPTVHVARSYRDSGAPVYLYEFQHRSSIHKDSRPDYVKADHSDEIPYVFGLPFFHGAPVFSGKDAEAEIQLSKTIMNYWANFAHTGNPNSNGLVEWPRYDENEGYLELNLRQRKAEKLRKKQVDFWDKILHGRDPASPEVFTKYGGLRGQRVKVSAAERDVNVFLGIPYAKPPVGKLRFAPPERAEPWSGHRDATSYPPMCLQDPVVGQALSDAFTTRKEKLPLTVSEDCLYLNVYTVAHSDTKRKLPVMVWIHGGGLLLGAASTYDGTVLAASEDVVVVTIQYRLGIIGFYSTGDEAARGNWGLLDQVAALQWIQENIAEFGGDPGSVTIFGESAGGFSVCALVTSPLAKGLFHKAISESGVCLLDGLLDSHPENLAKNIAEAAGCKISSSSEMVHCLKEKTEEEILQATLKMDLTRIELDKKEQKHTVFSNAVVDGVFFPKPPKDLLAERKITNVPYIIGVNNHECGWIVPNMLQFPDFTGGLDKATVNTAIRGFEQFTNVAPEHAHIIADEYLKDIEDPVQLRDQLLDMLGDVIFVAPGIQTARYYRDAGYLTYVYEFQHRPSLHGDLKPDFVKADHGDEIGFVFGRPLLGDNANEEERNLSKTVMKYWANFARTGNPNGDGIPTWPQYDQKEQYLEIGLKQKVAKKLKEERVAFWTKTLPEKIAESKRKRTEL